MALQEIPSKDGDCPSSFQETMSFKMKLWSMRSFSFLLKISLKNFFSFLKNLCPKELTLFLKIVKGGGEPGNFWFLLTFSISAAGPYTTLLLRPQNLILSCRLGLL